MKKIVRLTENDLSRIVKRVLSENQSAELKSKINKISNKKVPGSRSMQVCAILTVSDNETRKSILDGCTSESWGASCTWAVANIPINEFTSFTNCTLSCANTTRYKGVFCSIEEAIAKSDYTIK